MWPTGPGNDDRPSVGADRVPDNETEPAEPSEDGAALLPPAPVPASPDGAPDGDFEPL